MSHKKCHDGYKERVENSEKRRLRPNGPDLEKEIKKDHKKKSKEALKHEKQRHHDVKRELRDERKHWKQLDSYAREVKFKDLEENGFYCKTENACVQCSLEPIPGTSQDPDWICDTCQDEHLDGEIQYSELDLHDVREEEQPADKPDHLQKAPSSEVLSSESSSELIWRSLLTDEEWMKYVAEKKRMQKEKLEHIRKLKEEHQTWKQKQREDHNEFKRKQKEAHKEWKKRQKQEHDEWRRKLKMNHEDGKRKNKTKMERDARKKNGDESSDSDDSEDSEDDEEEDDRHRNKIVPWRKNHEGGIMHSMRNMFHHAAQNLYRASGAKRTWKYFKKKIIRRYLRRTYRNLSRQINSFFELFDTKVGNGLILLGLLLLGVFLGGYLFSHLHRHD